MKITTPEEFAAAPRREVVDMLCERIERELGAGRRSIPAGMFEDGWMRSSELEAAAELYRAVGWTVYVAPHAKDYVVRFVDPSRLRRTVPGSTLADHIGSPDSASLYREGKDR